jgi:hypothetical protein
MKQSKETREKRRDSAVVAKHPPIEHRLASSCNGDKVSPRVDRGNHDGKAFTIEGVSTLSVVKHLPKRGLVTTMTKYLPT